jgi:hypothetical protein
MSCKACLQTTIAISATWSEYMTIKASTKESVMVKKVFILSYVVLNLALSFIVIIRVLFISLKIKY